MADHPSEGESAESWVVDVTAPLPPARVRLVAAEAAARLKLPVEKLIALLENRIGPVTKPLPRASADRVAEVLELAGAEVEVRPATSADGPARQRDAGGEGQAPAQHAHAGETAAEEAVPPQPDVARATPQEEAPEEDVSAGAEAGASEVRPSSEPRTGRSRDAFDAMHDEPEEDTTMLGRWSRTARQASREEAQPAAATATAREAPPPPPGVFEVDDEEDLDEDEDEDMFAYGIRDPLADADREERIGRRMVLLGALVVATLVFLALQWAVSDAALSGPSPAPYATGLAAYREGAFVEASRAWHPRAEAGDARAMFMLGYMAEVGQGRPWSNREAAEWYRQAAQRGHPQAQARLAGLYERGMGVERDLAAALTWYRRAGDAGVAEAELAAARLLAGSGVLAEARDRLDRAATVLPEAAAWRALARAAPR